MNKIIGRCSPALLELVDEWDTFPVEVQVYLFLDALRLSARARVRRMSRKQKVLLFSLAVIAAALITYQFRDTHFVYAVGILAGFVVGLVAGLLLRLR